MSPPLPPGLQALHAASLAHRQSHGCEAYSFEDGRGLYALAQRLQPRRVLELGTALGYTAAIFASASPHCIVDTIEADALHVRLAREHLAALQLQRVTVHAGRFEAVLPTLQGGYDLAFFDGYAPTISLLQGLKSLLSIGGHLVCGNLGLAGAGERRALRAELDHSPRWQTRYLLEHGATAVARKLID